jgi:hypothetical protein
LRCQLFEFHGYIVNKTQPICLLVAILIVATAGAWLHARNRHHEYVLAHGRMIGEELITTTNSTKVVHLEQRLRSRLAELLSSPTRVDAVWTGDAFKESNRADVCVALSNQDGLVLGLRIKRANKSNSFHILGYWTIAEGSAEPK